MAISILSNTSAMMSLSELNRNVYKRNDSLEKISNGVKINSAKDDGAGYSISEKMLSNIRALNQDEENVQNASALLKVAAGGIGNIVEELRNLKELAINAATDTNTDDDRRYLQKMFEQKMANIDDIASTTNYNGKHLLDGTYSRKITEILVPGNGGGGNAFDPTDLTDGFNTVNSTKVADPPEKNGTNQYTIDSAYTSSDGSTYGGYIEVGVDFSSITINNGASVPEALNDKGFIILCGGCDQYVNIVFDGTKTTEESLSAERAGRYNTSRQYTIGIKNVESLDDLPAAIYNGLQVASTLTKGSNFVTIDNSHSLQMNLLADGSYSFSKNGPYMEFSGTSIINVDGEQVQNKNEEVWRTVLLPPNPLVIHHGPKANEATNIYINDMHIKALDKDLENYQITTRTRATSAIGILDNALKYALDEATTVGAYQRRFEYTESNVVTMNENIQAANSTIRDADMAREMTNYTKSNVLAQAAQSMLAQANQLPMNVVSMLQ